MQKLAKRSSLSASGEGSKRGFAQRKISWRKNMLFRILCCLMPLILLLVSELTLRLVGSGVDSHFFIADAEQPGMMHQNDRFGQQFMARELVRRPLPLWFSQKKGENTLRIVVLGSSAAQGDPAPEFSFARQLGVMLATAFPGTKIEILNTSMVAMNSHVMRAVSCEVPDVNPDFVLVYIGNNEVVGPFGPASHSSGWRGSNLALAINRICSPSRVFQTFRQISLRSSSREGQWAGMELFLHRQFEPDASALEQVYRNYEANLVAILRTMNKAGIPVLITTIPVNLRDCPPFGSSDRPNVSVSSDAELQYEKLMAEVNESDHSNGMNTARGALPKKAQSADQLFILGKSIERQDSTKALELLRNARDADTLRFRADSKIQETITKLCRTEKGVALVDGDQALNLACDSTSQTSACFYDHVHLTFRGNYLLAAEFFKTIQPLIQEKMKVHSDATIPNITKIASELGYSNQDEKNALVEMRRRFSKPPFQYQLAAFARLASLDKRIDRIASVADDGLETLKRALQNNPGDYYLLFKLGNEYLKMAKPEEARVCFEKAVASNPWSARAWANLGTTALSVSKPDRAIPYLKKSLAIDPTLDYALHNLGNAYAMLDQVQEAEKYYKKTLAVNSGYAEAWQNLGKLLDRTERRDQAEWAYARANAIGSDNVALRNGLPNWHGKQPNQAEREIEAGLESLRQSDLESALNFYKRAAAGSPLNERARQNLCNALLDLNEEASRRGDWDREKASLRLLCELQPDNPEFLNNYAYSIVRSPTRDGAEAGEAIRIARESARLTNYKNPAILDTLIRASMAGQDWREAKRLMPIALALAQSEGSAEVLSSLQDLKTELEQQE